MSSPNGENGTETGSRGARQATPESYAPANLVGRDGQAPYKPAYIPLWNNFITIAGLFLAATALMLLLTFALFAIVSPATNPYVDIVGYIVLPGILVIGLVLTPFGILVKSWRLHRRDPEQKVAFRFPHFDLNDPMQRRVAKLVVGGTFVLLPAVGVSSYHGYHYTDSAGFCSKVCHEVMEPEATTYEYSAHARVSCAECHIGEGASWFVKSKLSGTRQVLAVMRDSYSRPIPPAIRHLRPARETCEHCHWPKKFFGAQLREIVYFTSDEQNTRHEIDMLLNTGGGDETMGRREGIHMHMALVGTVKYVATDDRLQEIPWVEYTDAAGNVSVFRSDDKPSSDPLPDGQLRQLDCMDCHNRPAHKFRAPSDAVDLFLDVGRIDPSLPYVKREAVAALCQPYPDTETAVDRIGAALAEFYRGEYPEVWRERRIAVNKAIDGVRDIYRQTIFPRMKVDWRTYPDNIGHKISPGCFRCHEGKHVNQDGETISHACDVCHTFLNPVERGVGRAVVERGDFVHPVALEGSHATLRCDKCHDGGISPLPTCTGCHTAQVDFGAGTLAAFRRFAIGPDAMADGVDCVDCHDLAEPTTIESIDAMCRVCHDEDYDGVLASWKAEAERLMAEAEGRADEEGRRLLRALRQAGPLHNIEATRVITRAVTQGREGADVSADENDDPPS